MVSTQSRTRRLAIQLVFLELLLTLLVGSCSNAQPSPAPVATVSPVATATLFPTSTATPRATATLPPTPSPWPMRAWNFKVAYVIFQKTNNKLTTQLWVLESPYQTPQLILTAARDQALSNSLLAWSHDGQRIAFSHITKGQAEAISIVDIVSLQQQDLFSDSRGALEMAGPNSWSADDHWLAVTLRYHRTADDGEHRKTILVSTTDHQTFALEDNHEFVSWLPNPPDHFLYLTDPQSPSSNPTVQIGKVGQAEPVSSLKLSPYTPQYPFYISVAPDGSRAIATSFDGDYHAFILALDLRKNEAQLLPYTPQGVLVPDLWSPNDEWLTFWQGNKWYFWEFNQSSEPVRTPLSLIDGMPASIWAPDSSQLLYQDGQALYAVNPAAPQSPSLVLDLAALGIKSEELDVGVTTNLWMPALP